MSNDGKICKSIYRYWIQNTVRSRNKQTFVDRFFEQPSLYLQLPSFTKEESDCKTDFDRWIYIFKNMEILNRIPWAAKNSVFHRLGELAEVANMSEKQRRSYDKDLKILRDSYNILEFAKKEARKEGKEEGREEGIAQGIVQGREEMAVEMLRRGMSVELVSEIAKLTVERVETLRSQLSFV